jgi:hypothetical protein
MKDAFTDLNAIPACWNWYKGGESCNFFNGDRAMTASYGHPCCILAHPTGWHLITGVDHPALQATTSTRGSRLSTRR